MHHAELAPFPSGFLWGASTSAYEVEVRDLARTKKESFHWYRTVIVSNGAHLTLHQPTPTTTTENQT